MWRHKTDHFSLVVGALTVATALVLLVTRGRFAGSWSWLLPTELLVGGGIVVLAAGVATVSAIRRDRDGAAISDANTPPHP